MTEAGIGSIVAITAAVSPVVLAHGVPASVNDSLLKSQHRRDEKKALERIRMRKINDAYDRLRGLIPVRPEAKQKFSKLETLLFARDYIEALNKTLHNEPRSATALNSGESHINKRGLKRKLDDPFIRALNSRTRQETTTELTHRQ
ncbi:unnamed protein product [Gongylonema pulchrum]|uniref:BHLH domain-containing protein n=1 Tax=Gongylonema pulchrum TaxID=637853 RepID=A0A183D4S8_9BILA|nr:unnamed protein product [Gongylonema pulchrum]